MIIALLINIIVSMFGVLFGFFPVVTLNDIPVVGEFVRSTFVMAIGFWNAFIVTFPYAALPWHIFIYAVLPFEVLLIILKFFLGSRAPQNYN